MSSHILRRLLSTIPVAAVVAIFVFLLMRLAPGDPAALIAGEDATSIQIAVIREQLGLDLPIWQQFSIWAGGILRGDLGTSIFSNVPVSTLIGQRLEPTLMLMIATLVVAVSFAIPLGVIAAWNARTTIDRLVMILSVLGFAIPVFLAGYVLIYVFSIQLRWLPVQGYRPISEGIWPCIKSLILPAIALGTSYIALIARTTRASMLEVLSQDYIRTAHAKGLSTYRILMVHSLKNASIPIVTIVGIGISLLISGVVITETVFNIPGLGRLTVDAVLKRDYPVMQGLILLFAVMKVIINLLVDLSYALFDPRIKH